mgnify:FL=1
MQLWIVQVRETCVIWAITTSEELAKKYIEGAACPEHLRYFVTWQTEPGVWRP